MSTEAATTEAVPRIVRMRHTAVLALVGTTVLASTWLGVRRDAWAPAVIGETDVTAWRASSVGVLSLLADLQTGLGALLWPADPIAGAVAVAAMCSALAAVALAHLLGRAGLPRLSSGLLALVAAFAPLAQWQGASPLGASPATLAGVAALWSATTRPHMRDSRWPTSSLPWIGRLLLGICLALALLNHRLPAFASLARAEVGMVGLVLLLANFLARRPDLPTRPAVLTGASLLLLTAWAAPTARLAVLLPCVWWLIGTGVSTLVALRGATAARWAVVGLATWASLHALQVPWLPRQQAAALARTWAEGVIAAADREHPVVVDSSAGGRLLAGLARHRSPDLVIAAADVRTVLAQGREPLVHDADTRDALRWQGIGFAAGPNAGIPLHRLLDALPRHTIVLAAISREAAGSLSARDWQALGRIGSRQMGAARGRAHALVGTTDARVTGLHEAGSTRAQVDVQPGDPIGRVDARSPVDARLEADTAHVTVTWRGRQWHRGPGVVVLAFSTRGDLLGWRHGDSPARLHGGLAGRDTAIASRAVAALPCVDAAAGARVDLTTVARTGGLAFHGTRPARVELALDPPATGDAPAFAVMPTTHAMPPAPRVLDAAHVSAVVGPGTSGGYGLALRRHVTGLTALADAPVRVCGAWPVAEAYDAASGALRVGMGPADDPYLGAGWHGREQAGHESFRWMAGPRAEVQVVLQRPSSFRLAIDAQAVASPRPGDLVRVSVNGRDLGERHLAELRARHIWDVPAEFWRSGLNVIEIETTLTVRPADRTPGADGRTLGLAVHGWSLTPAAAASAPGR